MIRSIPSASVALSLLLFFYCNLINEESIVDAYPTGAGGCAPDYGSVGGAHLSSDAQITNGSLSNFDLAVDLDDDVMVPGQSYEVLTNKEYKLFLYADGDVENQFKGFLFRLSREDKIDNSTVGLLMPPNLSNESSNLVEKEADECTNIDVAGVTHTGNELKNAAVALLNIDEAGVYSLQVTAVASNGLANNNAYISQFYWDKYTFTAIANTGTTEPAAAPDGPPPSPSTPAPAPSGVTSEWGSVATTLILAISSMAYASIL